MKSLSGKAAQKWLTAVAIVVAVGSVAGGVALHHSRNVAADKEAHAHHKVNRTDAVLDSADVDAKPLKIGSVAQVGPDYSVAVSKVTLHEGAGTPFLVVTVKAKNVGRTASHPRTDLAMGFSKPNTPTSDESTCEVDLGKLAVTKASLAVGEEQTYGVCVNLPSNVIKNGRVFVAANGTGSRVSWATSGRIPKVISTAEPEVHMAAPPPPDPAVTAKSLKGVKKQLKKAKKARDTISKQIKLYKQVPNYKKKKLKKFEKAKDQLDEIIKQLEKIEKQLGG